MTARICAHSSTVSARRRPPLLSLRSRGSEAKNACFVYPNRDALPIGRGRRTMRVTPVGKGIYGISLAWGNAYLLTEGDAAALIDTGLQKDRTDLLQALQQCGIRPEQVQAVYLTHAHCDHAGNAAYFARLPHCPPIILHRAEAPFLNRPRRTYIPRGWRGLTRPHTALAFAIGEWRFPVERSERIHAVEDGETLDAPGGPLQVLAS